MSRVYEGGRSTKGWKKGERITRLEDLTVGLVVIMVSHQFPSENLIRIVERLGPEFDGVPHSWEYVEPNGRPTGEYIGSVWEFELTGEARAFYRAIKE